MKRARCSFFISRPSSRRYRGPDNVDSALCPLEKCLPGRVSFTGALPALFSAWPSALLRRPVPAPFPGPLSAFKQSCLIVPGTRKRRFCPRVTGYIEPTRSIRGGPGWFLGRWRRFSRRPTPPRTWHSSRLLREAQSWLNNLFHGSIRDTQIDIDDCTCEGILSGRRRMMQEILEHARGLIFGSFRGIGDGISRCERWYASEGIEWESNWCCWL